MSSRVRTILLLIGVFLLLGSAAVASLVFQGRYVGWLIADIENPMEFKAQWQAILAEAPDLKHPAVIHFQPEGCLCYSLSSRHAGVITETAQTEGFHVYQLNTARANMGETLQTTRTLPVGPLIAITRPDGTLRYAGAYSDGIRCNTGTSMVDSFLTANPQSTSATVIGLDVETCRCLTD